MHPRDSKQLKTPHPRLALLIGRIAQHFEGKPIHIISGYRKPGGYTRKTSKHTLARALDFRVEGVSNTALRDFCRRFANVGVGFYPHSGFIHLDVRNKNAFWIDASRPGEAPKYVSRDYMVAQATRTKSDQSLKPKEQVEAIEEESAVEREDEQEPQDTEQASPQTSKATPNIEKSTSEAAPVSMLGR